MDSAETGWEIIRQQFTRALGHEIDETSWQTLSTLPPEFASAELPWRIEALRPQIPAQGTIYLHPIRQQAVDSESTGTCFLCGDPLPAPGRYRCNPCAIAAQLVLAQPVQFVGITVPAAHARSLTNGDGGAETPWIG